jgi:hypothetical protein
LPILLPFFWHRLFDADLDKYNFDLVYVYRAGMPAFGRFELPTNIVFEQGQQLSLSSAFYAMTARSENVVA